MLNVLEVFEESFRLSLRIVGIEDVEAEDVCVFEDVPALPNKKGGKYVGEKVVAKSNLEELLCAFHKVPLVATIKGCQGHALHIGLNLPDRSTTCCWNPTRSAARPFPWSYPATW